MRLLLDTHIFLALIGSGAAGLPATVAAKMKDEDAEVYLSAASLWEIAIKWRLGKLRLTAGLDALPKLVSGLGVRSVPIDERHALTAVDPEPATRDPFDRILIAQAIAEGLPLLSSDRQVAAYPIRTVWKRRLRSQ